MGRRSSHTLPSLASPPSAGPGRKCRDEGPRQLLPFLFSLPSLLLVFFLKLTLSSAFAHEPRTSDPSTSSSSSSRSFKRNTVLPAGAMMQLDSFSTIAALNAAVANVDKLPGTRSSLSRSSQKLSK